MKWYYIFIYVALIAIINQVLKNYTEESKKEDKNKNKTKKRKKPIDKK